MILDRRFGNRTRVVIAAVVAGMRIPEPRADQ
jgi:hypothetical protein